MQRFWVPALGLVLMLIGGCEGSAPVSELQKKEMTSTPWGVFSGTGDSQGAQVQFEAGNTFSYTDNQTSMAGTYTLDEANRKIVIEQDGTKQEWTYERNNLDLKITFPNGKTGTFTMQ
jgi:hypothetical protein